MAWLFKRPNSPYWYIGYRKSTGKPAESTRLRYDDPCQTREARDKLRQANADESFSRADAQKFSRWVPEWLRIRYSGNVANLKSYTNRWKALEAFLSSRKVLYPKDLAGQHAWDYVVWRTGPGKREGGIRRARKNTALEEIKMLRMIMRHAIAVGYASRSPIDGIRIPWDDPKEKPEIEPEHLPVIMKALKKQPKWMAIQFRISFYTGCRLNDSRVLLRHVDLTRKLIHFPEAKGKKPFTVPCPTALIPLFVELKSDALRKWAFDPDCTMRGTSARWIHFFRSLQMPYSFHCCRVSYISALCRSGVPESVALRLVNHCSVLVHRIYLRLRGQDLREWADSISLPTLDLPEIQDGPVSTS